jgi:hypothetical protein
MQDFSLVVQVWENEWLLKCRNSTRIVTDKVLEDFLLAGMLGMPIDTDNYTPHQINTIVIWYQSGVEKYEPSQYDALFDLLNEIFLSIRFCFSLLKNHIVLYKTRLAINEFFLSGSIYNKMRLLQYSSGRGYY